MLRRRSHRLLVLFGAEIFESLMDLVSSAQEGGLHRSSQFPPGDVRLIPAGSKSIRRYTQVCCPHRNTFDAQLIHRQRGDCDHMYGLLTRPHATAAEMGCATGASRRSALAARCFKVLRRPAGRSVQTGRRMRGASYSKCYHLWQRFSRSITKDILRGIAK